MPQIQTLFELFSVKKGVPGDLFYQWTLDYWNTLQDPKQTMPINLFI